jgi:hypothetical protein
MGRNPTDTHDISDRFLTYGYAAILTFLTLSGFGQMPIFKRYYIADIPGLGWLAKFFITHYIHYLGAILLLVFFAYWVVQYLLVKRNRIEITRSGYLRAAMLGGILISGGFMVFRNLDGVWLPPGFIILLNLVHLGLVMMFLATAFYCLISKKTWTRVPSTNM